MLLNIFKSKPEKSTQKQCANYRGMFFELHLLLCGAFSSHVST